METILQNIYDFLISLLSFLQSIFQNIVDFLGNILDAFPALLNGIKDFFQFNFFNILLGFVISIFNLICVPINSLIKVLLPFGIDDFLESVNNLLNAFINFVPYIANMTFLPSFVIHLMVDYVIFKYTVKFTVFSVKRIVQWYNVLKH